jgi:hypothetical protein
MGLPISVVVQENYKGGEMKLELFNITRGKVFHWFILSLGDWFSVWFTTVKFFNRWFMHLGIRFGNKEFRKDWKLR